MKVLWITNSVLPSIAQKLNYKSGVNEGWLSGLADVILSQEDITLGVCFPDSKIIKGKINEKLIYYTYEREKKPSCYLSKQENTFELIFEEFKPDIIHIMGSEYPHSLAAVRASVNKNLIEKTILSVQGLISVICEYYYANLPFRTVAFPTIKDIIKRTSLFKEKKDLSIRGRYEVEAISKLKNIMGRTDWDYACVKFINNDIRYFFNNETLRKEFYTDDIWKYEICEKHSIFISQATMPYKGFHVFLEAAGLVKKNFPDLKIYVASNVNYLKRVSHPNQTRSAYTNYIIDIIKKYSLEENIVFCGALSAKEMKTRYLKSNVFVLPSAIENSPNSLGEAMILGVPCVSTDVGGVKNMIVHDKEGFVCQYNASYMMAYYIMRIFDEGKFAEQYGKHARLHALKIHNREQNYKQLFNIYKELQN